jgi:hypothetical protein
MEVIRERQWLSLTGLSILKSRHPRRVLNSFGRVSLVSKEHRRVGSNARPDAR